MTRYAAHTVVPVEKSRLEIERILTRYGATRFGNMSSATEVTIYFEVKGRQLQWTIPMPPEPKYASHANNVKRDQEIRRRWRVLIITMKALLEAVDSKLMTFDEAFLAHVVMPGTGRTLGAAIVPRLDRLYQGLSLPALLAENPEP